MGLGKQPLLPNEKDARGSHKKPGELLTALSLRAEARGALSANLAETQRPRLALEGVLANKLLLLNEKVARGSYKKPEKLLTALLLRAEATELFL